jgi:protein-L-isoaspartate(D-aspartate) O-methyltransferase
MTGGHLNKKILRTCHESRTSPLIWSSSNRTWMLDPQILTLFAVKREEFVPPAYRSLAFADLESPLDDSRDPGRKMWPPKLEARVVQELHLLPSDEVLEIGTGSGYLSALLARRAQRVISVEIDPGLAAAAAARLAAHGITNVQVETGDGARGWRAGQLFDAIVLTGSSPVQPDALIGAQASGRPRRCRPSRRRTAGW